MNNKLKNALDFAENSTPPQAAPIKLVETRTLKVEVCLVLYFGLEKQFLYRIIEPVPTVWKLISIPVQQLMAQGYEEALKMTLLQEWNDMTTSPGGLPVGIEWMREVDSVNIIECEIVPTETNK